MKLIFELVVQDLNVTSELRQQKQLVKDLTNELLKVPKASEQYRQLVKELADAKTKVIALTAEQKRLNNEFKAATVPTDSLAGLRLEYSKLTEQISRLSAAERKSPVGQDLIKNAGAIKQQINQIEESVGRFTGSVGNYRKGILQIGDVISGGLVTGGIVVAVQKIIEVMKIGISEAIGYGQALSDLSALTGVTGPALDNLDRIAKSLQVINVEGVQVTNTGSAILEGLKLVGGARPELLKDADALGEVTKQAIILQKASGDDLPTSVRGLTTILGQFKEPATAASRIINELAAGAKEGSAEIPAITDAMEKFGTVAKISNVSTSQSVALVELLADRQLKGAEAGTQLRNILAKLASADVLPKKAQAAFAELNIDVDVLKNSTLPLQVRLNELAKANGNLGALTRIFGLENLAASTIITSGLPKYEELQTRIEGTNEALKQAAIRADNTNTALENLKNKGLNQLRDDFTAPVSVIGSLIGSLDNLATKGGRSLEIFGDVNRAIFDPVNRLLLVFKGLRSILKGKDSVTETAHDSAQSLGELTDIAFDGKGKIDSLSGTIFDMTGNLVAQAEKMQILASETGDAVDNIDALTTRIKTLKRELGQSAIGSAQFKELSKQLVQAQKDLKKAQAEAGVGSGSKLKKEIDPAAGSVAYLTDQISKLQKLIDASPNDAKILTPFINKLKDAERELKALQAKIDNIKNPKQDIAPTLAEIDKILRGVGLGEAKREAIALTDKERDNVVDANRQIVDNEQLTADQVLALQQDLTNKKIGLTKDELDAAKAAAKEKQDYEKRVKDASIETAGQIAIDIFEIEKNKNQNVLDDALSALSTEYDKKKEAAQGNADQISVLDKEYQKKKDALEKEAAKKRKHYAMIEAGINTAVAVTKALTGAPPPFSFILAGLAAAAGALQIAVIASQKFARGGAVKMGKFQGKPHSQGGTKGSFDDGTNVEVEKDEMFFILNRRASQKINQLSEFNARHGGNRFAAGGSLDFTPQIAPPGESGQQSVIVVQSGFTAEQMIMFAKTVAEETALQTKKAVVEGLDDRNRTAERQSTLDASRQI